MLRNLLIMLALVATVGLPFALRPKNSLLGPADETLVVITPHNESIRAEFARGFRDWYKARTGKVVRVDWRVPGGTTEISKYLASEYTASFENYWRAVLHRPWSEAVEKSFDSAAMSDPKRKPYPKPADEADAQAARKAFLESPAGVGIDLFFGGGSYDFVQQSTAGRLVDSGFIKAHPDLFNDGPAGIPQTLAGEPFYDKSQTWFGAVVSAFGICYNDGVLERLHIAQAPQNWDSLTDPAYIGQVALADPNKSGSVAKAFEMIIQQAIQQEVDRGAATGAAAGGGNNPEAQKRSVTRGWEVGMQRILKMGANTRYFTDSSPKIPIDVGEGDSAIGMSIDFYGRFQAASTKDVRTGKERMHYFSPPNGTSIGVDPIGLLRGAPHRALALQFLDYVLSVEGQKLWNYRPGTPGGPQEYALWRLPIRRDLYTPEFNHYRSNPDVFPYEDAKGFTYHPEWTAALFSPLRFIVRVMCIDSHDEAREAWAEIIKAKQPPEALKVFLDVSRVSYAEAGGKISAVLKSPDKLAEVRLANEMTEYFRGQYRRAAGLAREGK